MSLGDILKALEFPCCHLEYYRGIRDSLYATTKVLGFGLVVGVDVCTYRACTDVSNFSTFNDIVQCPHNFGPGRLAIQSVDLQDINVCAETCHACIHGIEDVLSGQAYLIDIPSVIGALGPNPWLIATRIDTKVAFAQDNDLGTRYVIFPQGFSDDFFGATIRVYVCLLARAILRLVILVKDKKLTVSHVLSPTLYACSSNGSASFSFKTQSCQSELP